MSKANELLQDLTQQIESISNSEEFLKFLDMKSSLYNYSLRNCMLLYIQRKNITMVASFNKWKELNRIVKKGEKALYVVAPSIHTVKNSDGTDKLDKNGEVEKCVCGFRAVPVFDISQTDGEPLPAFGSWELKDDTDYSLLFDKISSTTDYNITVKKLDGIYGCVVISAKEIYINESASWIEKVTALIHEIGHASLHHDKADYSTSLREIEAESFSYVVSKLLGLEIKDSSINYIKHYLVGIAKADSENLLKAMARVNKALQPILNKLSLNS